MVVKTFPLKLSEEFNREIDETVFIISRDEKITKHQFIVDAIKEKIEKESKKYNVSL